MISREYTGKFYPCPIWTEFRIFDRILAFVRDSKDCFGSSSVDGRGPPEVPAMDAFVCTPIYDEGFINQSSLELNSSSTIPKHFNYSSNTWLAVGPAHFKHHIASFCILSRRVSIHYDQLLCLYPFLQTTLSSVAWSSTAVAKISV